MKLGVKKKRLPIAVERKLNRIVRFHGLDETEKNYWYQKLLTIHEAEKQWRTRRK